jgi:hypothetical protein
MRWLENAAVDTHYLQAAKIMTTRSPSFLVATDHVFYTIRWQLYQQFVWHRAFGILRQQKPQICSGFDRIKELNSRI